MFGGCNAVLLSVVFFSGNTKCRHYVCRCASVNSVSLRVPFVHVACFDKCHPKFCVLILGLLYQYLPVQVPEAWSAARFPIRRFAVLSVFRGHSAIVGSVSFPLVR